MKWADQKITIIGLGFLMEYIFPCFQQAMGENVYTHINAVTADEKDAQGKRDRLGIEVLLNDNDSALRKLVPDFIFFAPPPSVAPALTETCLIPYYRECREQGRKLPVLVAFPPSPKGAFYLEKLGEDIKVVNIIPNMISAVGDEKVPNESSHLITYPDHDNWTEAEKAFLNELLSPMGRCLNVPPQLILPVLSAEIATHPLTELANTAALRLNALGIECDYHQTASAMRACHQQRRGYTAPGTNACSEKDVANADAVELMARIADAWYDGLHAYLTEKGFPAQSATALLNPLFDLYFHEAQLESRETIVAKARKDATPGGMLELCMERYFKLAEPRIEALFTAALKPCKADVAEIGRLMAEITAAVAERGGGLTAVKAPTFGPKQHAVMFALIAKHALRVFGAEADDLLYKAVERYGNERGERMALHCRRNGDPTDDMASYFAYGEWKITDGFEKTIPSQKLPYLDYRVLQCPWCTAWKETGLLPYAPYYCRCMDKSILKGFHPTLALEMPTWLSDPQYDCCHFMWKSAENTAERVERQKALMARLNGSQVKDFQYHTAHLYQSLLHTFTVYDSVRAAQVEDAVRREFAQVCSSQELLRVLELSQNDFTDAQS